MPPKEFDVTDRTVVVTGASRGQTIYLDGGLTVA